MRRDHVRLGESELLLLLLNLRLVLRLLLQLRLLLLLSWDGLNLGGLEGLGRDNLLDGLGRQLTLRLLNGDLVQFLGVHGTEKHDVFQSCKNLSVIDLTRFLSEREKKIFFLIF